MSEDREQLNGEPTVGAQSASVSLTLEQLEEGKRLLADADEYDARVEEGEEPDWIHPDSRDLFSRWCVEHGEALLTFVQRLQKERDELAEMMDFLRARGDDV